MSRLCDGGDRNTYGKQSVLENTAIPHWQVPDSCCRLPSQRFPRRSLLFQGLKVLPQQQVLRTLRSRTARQLQGATASPGAFPSLQTKSQPKVSVRRVSSSDAPLPRCTTTPKLFGNRDEQSEKLKSDRLPTAEPILVICYPGPPGVSWQ